MLLSEIKCICGIIVVLGISILSSCNYNNGEEKYPKTVNQVLCDTANVSFKNTIQPILITNCYACHDEKNYLDFGGGYNFEGYDNLMSNGLIDAGKAENSKIYRSVARLSNAQPMPKDRPKLPDCDINRIKAWINQGAKNN
jgi:hypothetical protein